MSFLRKSFLITNTELHMQSGNTDFVNTAILESEDSYFAYRVIFNA